MTDKADTTMVASKAADSSFKEVTNPKKSKRHKPALEQKIAVKRDHVYTIRITFPAPRTKTAFNPITSMRIFFKEMIKYDSTITIVIPNDSKQITLSNDAIPAMEVEFKKFFTIDTKLHMTGNKSQVIVRCYITSNRTLKEIKLDSTRTTKFMDWLKKEKIFVDTDLLGVRKMVTIGYLFKLHTRLTNCSTLKELLSEELNEVVIDPDLAVTLDPSLKDQQTAAMTNGDTFVSELPPFEIYQTEISYGRDKQRIKTDVLAIKCSIKKARLLKEFFSQIANLMEMEKKIGMFVPTGAVHLIRPEAYTNLLCANNEFLQSITTVPMGDFQHETLNTPFSTDKDMDIHQTNLFKLITEQSWCINVERSFTPNKVIFVTTKGQLQAARKWADDTFPEIYKQYISDKIDVTTLQQITPRRLDKPMVTEASQTYAEKLKQRMTYSNSSAAKTNQFARPPRVRTPKPSMTFDEASFPPLNNNTNNTATATTNATSTANSSKSTASTSSNSITSAATHETAPYDYRAELQRITEEIETTLKGKIESALTQLDEKFEQKLKQIETNVDQKLQQLEPIATAQVNLQTTQANQARDIELLTKNMNYLMKQVANIADRIKQFTMVPNNPTLRSSVGMS